MDTLSHSAYDLKKNLHIDIPELLLWPGRHTWVPPEPSQSGSPLLTTMSSVCSSL